MHRHFPFWLVENPEYNWSQNDPDMAGERSSKKGIACASQMALEAETNQNAVNLTVPAYSFARHFQRVAVHGPGTALDGLSVTRADAGKGHRRKAKLYQKSQCSNVHTEVSQNYRDRRISYLSEKNEATLVVSPTSFPAVVRANLPSLSARVARCATGSSAPTRSAPAAPSG